MTDDERNERIEDEEYKNFKEFGYITEIKEFSRNQVRTHPLITEARTKMTALELKAFYQVATLIQMDDSEFKEYEIDVLKFAEALGLPTTNRDFLKNTCINLAKQVFYRDYDNKNFDVMTIFSCFKYRHKEQKILIKFSEDIKPYLLNLKQFTKIQQVKYIKSFESKYAIRFYALLKDHRKMNQRDFSIEALNKMLGLSKSYENYRNFYDKVLKPAIKEINAKSDLWVSEPEIIGKRGKKITEFRLYYGNKSERMGDDFVKDLLQRYKKYKTFNIFAYAYYLPQGVEFKSTSDLQKITRIETNKNTYFTALSENITIFGTPNKDDFLKELANGIYRAVSALYEKEKQEQLPIMQWQDKKDKAKRIKQIFSSWQQADTPQKNF